MSEAFIKKNIKLSLEFDTYLAKHPKLFADIPNKSTIVITVSGDDKFNANSIAMAKNAKRKKVIEAHKSTDGWEIRPLQLLEA